METKNNLTIAQLEESIIEHVNKAEKSGEEWANAKALYEDLEDKRKSYLASLMPHEGSQAAKEQQALAEPVYGQYLNGLGEARKAYLIAQVKYEMDRLKIEVLRTLISTRREEVRNFKG